MAAPVREKFGMYAHPGTYIRVRTSEYVRLSTYVRLRIFCPVPRSKYVRMGYVWVQMAAPSPGPRKVCGPTTSFWRKNRKIKML